MISYSTIQGSYNVSYQTVLLLRKFIAQYKWAHAGLVGVLEGQYVSVGLWTWLVQVLGVIGKVMTGFFGFRHGYCGLCGLIVCIKGAFIEFSHGQCGLGTCSGVTHQLWGLGLNLMSQLERLLSCKELLLSFYVVLRLVGTETQVVYGNLEIKGE